jgi:hypothetical protein
MALVLREINGRQWKWCESCKRYENTHRCKYCQKKYKTPKGIDDHERICFLNPDRQCDTCKGEGGYFHYSDWVDCPACAEAEKRRKERADQAAWYAQWDDKNA